MNLNQKKHFTKLAVIWASCFVAFLIVYLVVILPQKSQKNKINERLNQSKQTFENALEISKPENRKKLIKEVENMENNLRNYAVNLDDSANLIFDISQIANEKRVSSFSITNKDNQVSSEIPGCKKISENRIQISFFGSFPQFATFLNSLERHRPIVFIDEFSLERSEESKNSHQSSMVLSVFAKKLGK